MAVKARAYYHKNRTKLIFYSTYLNEEHGY